jgi:tetratricopeptide (TPR) repeat protein
MKKIGAAFLVLGMAAAPASADRRVDEAVAKAKEQVQKGKPEDAVKTVQKVANSAEGYAALGHLQEQLGLLDDAAVSLQKAVEMSAGGGPARAEALAALSGLELRTKAGKDALAHADEAVKLQATPSTLSALARAQARTGKGTAAVETAEKAVQAGATTAEAHAAKGDALLAAGKGADAAAAYRKALELDASLHRARTGLARALLAQNKPAEAVAEARKASEADSKSGEAFAVLGLAVLAENKNNWNDAIAQAQQGAFLNPKDAFVQVAVGKIFDAAGNGQQAGEAYKRALEVDPSYGPAQAARVQALANSAKPEEVLPEVTRLYQATPNDPDVALVYGRLLARKQDWVTAVAPLQKAAEAMPNSAEAQALAGTALQYTHQSDDALEAYKKAVALDAQNVNYRSTFGLLLCLNKQYDQGITELKKVVAAPNYKDTAGYTNLGFCSRSIDPPRGPDAVSAYQKGLELDPKNAQAALGLGWALPLVDKYDEAVASFQKAMQLEPKLAGEAYNGIGWAQYFKKDMAQAKAAADKARSEGRNVGALLQAIDKFQKGQAAAAEEARKQMQQEQKGEEGGGIASLGAAITSKKSTPAAKIQALQGIKKFGAQAVEWMVYAAVNDADLGVRAQAMNALGDVGAPAKGQCAQIKQIANGANPYQATIAQDRRQMELEAEYADLQKAARAAIAKIGCN